MAIQMTRQEYEAKYGVKPVASTTETFDTTPAPVRMTRAEYEAQYYPKQETAPGLGSQLLKRGSDLIEAPQTERSLVQPLRPELRAAGAITGALSDVVGAAVAPVIEKTTKTIGGIGAVQDFANTPAVSKGLDWVNESISKVAEKWSGFEEKFPELAQDLRDATNILSTVPVGKGAAVAGETVVPKMVASLDERAIKNVADEIYNVETAYVKTRRANEFARGTDAASRERIARSGVLDGAVDADGKIITKTVDGPIAKYKAQTVDGLEDVVRLNLIDEGATVNLADVEKYLKEKVILASNKGIGFEGSDLVNALAGIKKEIDGLRPRANPDGTVPLYKIHDAKVGTTNRINYATPATESIYRKTIASAYKELVEQTSKTEVKKINSVLSKIYEDIARLERLDGARVKGGRLGKYTASLAGTGIGMAAGSFGGGVGAAIGGVVGGELAQALKGTAMSRSFKGGGKGLTKDATLTGAAAKVAYLKVPDKPVTVPKGVPKTKELTQLEDRIAKNVKQQETAIKAGDFAVVKALKEAYQVLVTKLQQIINEVVSKNSSPTSSSKLESFRKGKGSLEGGYVVNPLAKTPENKSKGSQSVSSNKDTTAIQDTTDDIIMENLMRIDPIDTDPIDTYRLIELQRIAEKRALTDNELLEARAIVENLDGSLPKAEAPKGKGATPQTTALLEEAKKYKSAEEFVKAQSGGDEILYHYTNADISDVIKPRADIELAEMNYFGDGAYVTNQRYGYEGKNELIATPRKDLKILDLTSQKAEEKFLEQVSKEIGTPVAKSGGGLYDDLRLMASNIGEKHQKVKNAVAKIAKGYDGIRASFAKYTNDDNFYELVVFEDVPVKTRTQLEDIWKQANRKD